ncbi:amidohydrolase [Pseudoduganella namucuonensis]|uniref:Amidohydrolase 3 domain-containing protein n=1 Tax=Pseudoduganella namucuonensis TaxID=1035707 RepID=A0A1I7L7B4_9BURK|nr:amidohydrolase [Pseudoduganella namucuonensis]SFV05619.1 hypothetical protein SAMN05216552_102448 [Pseudoduganella namucuonensis]
MRNKKLAPCAARRLAAGLTLALLPWLAAAATRAAPPDLIVRNGSIYTVRGETAWVEAFAVRDGRYVATGTNAEIARLAGPKTRVLDLRGAMAMPGINDVHAHPLDGGYEDLYACNFAPSSTFEQVLARVADCAARAEPGDWVVGGAWSSTMLAQVSTPAALAALDKAGAGHPVLLRDETFHNRWANSEALKRGGITRDSADPAGGVIAKDPASGQPTGLLKEFPAFLALERQIPPRTQARQLAAARAAGATMNACGITGVQDAFSSEAALAIWSQVDRDGGLPFHMVASLSAMPSAFPAERTGLALVEAREQYRGANLRPDFVKLFLDGVPPARTAEFLQPYLPDAEHGAHYHGHSNFTRDQLVDLLVQLDRRGVPAKMHATGDASLRLALDAVDEVRKRNGMPGQRHQVAHASFIADADLARFRALNVTAEISPMIWYPTGLGMATAMAIGKERAERIFPVASLLRSGALVAGGSDWPAGQPTANPWTGIEGLVTRRDPFGAIPGALWPEQAVGLASALRIYTINSAEAMGMGRETGSIETGKSADFIVLDRNLFRIPAGQIHETTVKQTFFRGRQVHPRAE